jgi:cysteine desulfurase/selenocysteine lyase
MPLDRRTFIEAVGASALAATQSRLVVGSAQALAGTGPLAWRREFPALAQQVNGHPIAYLDSAATTQRPRAVIDAVSRFYEGDNANPSATLHSLARRAADRYGSARATVARFLNAAAAAEVIFTKGTTEAINLVASTWGTANVQRGDEIVLTAAEHYSNLLPWRALAQRAGATIRTVDVDDDGRLLPSRVHDALTPRTRLLAFSHVSNVLGLVNPAREICEIARARNVAVLIDAAQSAPHLRLDVQALGCDFLACSGHKILGPMGVGVLWARQAVLDAMPPYQLGSNMAHEVDASSAQLEHGALRYQAGTPNVGGAVGLAAAIDTLQRYDMAAIARHDDALVEHSRARLATVPGLRVFGTLAESQARVPVFTFTLQGVSVVRLVQALDAQGVAVRGGDMAALPLLRRFGVAEAVRASCYLYTTNDEIDRLVDVLRFEAKQR